jgi:hypothetical protein
MTWLLTDFRAWVVDFYVLATLLIVPCVATMSWLNLKSVLAHEWAHIRHGDLGLLALGRCLLVVLFAHPIYWWLRRLIRDNQEALADAAATTHINRRDYADELLRWARTHVEHRAARISTALGLWEGRSQLSRRIEKLLDDAFDTDLFCSARWRYSATALIGVFAVFLSLLTVDPSRGARTEEVGPSIQKGSHMDELAEESSAGIVRLGGTTPRFGEPGPIFDFALSPDGKLMVTGTYSGRVSVWNLQTGKRLYSLDNKGEHPSIIAISPNGKLLAVGDDRHGTVRLWDLETGKELVTVQGLPGADSKVWSRGSLTFSPDSLILASGITRQQLVCDCVG